MMRLTKIFTLLIGGLCVLSTPALAQTVSEHGVFVLNSLLFLNRWVSGDVHGVWFLHA